ncbi:MAG: F0F1 ATP synthase subunit beta, partial [Desulfovibrionales bacterium]
MAQEYTGRITAIKGSVVDAEFKRGEVPPIRSVLHTGEEGAILVEVASHIDERHVRAIALTPTAGLARGESISGNGEPLTAPVGRELLGRMFNVFGEAIDGEEQPQGLDR